MQPCRGCYYLPRDGQALKHFRVRSVSGFACGKDVNIDSRWSQAGWVGVGSNDGCLVGGDADTCGSRSSQPSN